MQTTKQIIEIVKYFENGGEVTSALGGYGLPNPTWNFTNSAYFPLDYNFKVGDWVEIVYHDITPTLEGYKFQIDQFNANGWIFTKDLRCLFKPDNINYGIIKPAKAPKSEYVEFTADTFPKGLVFIKHKSWTAGYCLVTEFSDKVKFGSSHVISYAVLLSDEWQISLDGGNTWAVVGVKK